MFGKILDKIEEDKIIRCLKYGVILSIPFIILTPEIRLTSPAIRLDEILLALGTLFYLLLVLKRDKVKFSVVDYLFAALFISTTASIIFGYIGIGYDFYFNDFFEFAKLIKYYLIYRIVFDMSWDKDDMRHLVEVFVLSAALAILLGMMQYFNTFDINSLMTFFTKPNHIRAINVAGRIVGTFKNANSWSLFLGGTLFIIAADLVRSLEHKVSRKHYFILVLLFFALTSMIMTLGRTSIVANFIGLVVIAFGLWLFPYRDKARLKISREILIIFTLFVVFSGLSFYSIELMPKNRTRLNLMQRIGAGFQEMGLVGQDTFEGDFNSWNSRSGKWKNSVILALESPIFGYGPSKSDEAKENIPYATDNEYILYFYRYGLLGLILYISFFGFWASTAFINIKNTIKRLDTVFLINVMALGFAVAFPLYNILAGTFYDFQLFPLFMIFQSLNLHFLYEHDKHEKL